MAAERAERGVAVATWADGRQTVRPLPLDPIPRLVPAADWAVVAAGVEQRHRALNAFLAEAYRAAGRRRNDADRAPQVVRAGVLPEWAVAHSPGRDPDAVGQAWPGQPRATVAAADVLRTADGSWVVAKDHLRVPAGLGYALANRQSLRAALPALFAACGRSIPWTPCRCCGRGWRRRHRRASRGRRGSPSSPRGRATTRGSSTGCSPTRSAFRWCGPRTSGRAWTAGSR